MMTTSAQRVFALIANAPDEDIDLARGALLIAREAYPQLDVESYLSRLNDMADAVRAELPVAARAVDIIMGLNDYLFNIEGFRGNQQAYGDPKNSYLNEVLDRKLGIPITLSVVYLELGWRLGLDLSGLSFPGHFLVRCEHDKGQIVLDPFFNGLSLGVDDLIERAAQVTGDQKTARTHLPQFVRPALRREILARVLRNLKGIFANTNDFERALAMSDLICTLTPNEPHELRDRGQFYAALDCFRAAQADFQRYLELLPTAPDAGVVRRQLREAAAHVARLN